MCMFVCVFACVGTGPPGPRQAAEYLVSQPYLVYSGRVCGGGRAAMSIFPPCIWVCVCVEREGAAPGLEVGDVQPYPSFGREGRSPSVCVCVWRGAGTGSRGRRRAAAWQTRCAPTPPARRRRSRPSHPPSASAQRLSRAGLAGLVCACVSPFVGVYVGFGVSPSCSSPLPASLPHSLVSSILQGCAYAGQVLRVTPSYPSSPPPLPLHLARSPSLPLPLSLSLSLSAALSLLPRVRPCRGGVSGSLSPPSRVTL